MSSNAHIKDITIYQKYNFKLTRFNADGIGRTCDQALTRAADMIGDAVGRAAHKIGLGPEATMDRILRKLKARDREVLLQDWYRLPTGNEIFPGLEGDCHILLSYALPKEDITIQVTTFVALANLITQYPPLRSICLRYKKFNGVENPEDTALNLWKRCLNHAPSDPNWIGFYQMAAACLSDNVPCILEATPVEEWGKVSPTRLSVIDQLLAKISSEKLETLDYIAIRHLGGILQLETFWKRENYEEHKDTATVLLRKLLNCVKETGIEHQTGKELFCDREGIDVLVNVTLHGIQIWLTRLPKPDVSIQCWFDGLQELLVLLFKPEGQFYLPLSWHTATTIFQAYHRDRWIYKIGMNETEITAQGSGRRNERALERVSAESDPLTKFAPKAIESPLRDEVREEKVEEEHHGAYKVEELLQPLPWLNRPISAVMDSNGSIHENTPSTSTDVYPSMIRIPDTGGDLTVLGRPETGIPEFSPSIIQLPGDVSPIQAQISTKNAPSVVRLPRLGPSTQPQMVRVASFQPSTPTLLGTSVIRSHERDDRHLGKSRTVRVISPTSAVPSPPVLHS